MAQHVFSTPRRSHTYPAFPSRSDSPTSSALSPHERPPSPQYLGPDLDPSSFVPPFYNRPPTPLPPSPTLRSLLLPPTPSTPDPYDPDAVTASSRFAQSMRPYVHRPKVVSYEYYGFVAYVMSTLTFGVYLTWAFAPPTLLQSLEPEFYKAMPSRWWSLALPAWIVVVIVYMYVALAAYNTEYLTKGLEQLDAVVDEAANVAAVGIFADGADGPEQSGNTREDRSGERWDSRDCEPGDWRNMWNRGTDAVMDVPIGGVCEVLYGNVTDSDE